MINRTRIRIWVTSFALFLPLCSPAAGVTVFMLSGRSMEGDLLAVREDSVLLDIGGGYRMWEKEHRPNVVVLPFESLDHVVVEGSSYLWYGALGGLALGIFVGEAADSSDGQWGDLGKPWRIVGGGLGGLLVGSIIGATITSPDSTVTSLSPGGFSGLKGFAIYDEEPAFLRNIR